MRAILFPPVLAMFLAACGSTQQFTAVPENLDRNSVPHKTVNMTAEHFHFTPDTVHVPEGSLVTLKITAIDGAHGFSLGDFGIDESLPENEPKTITFYAAKKGEYGFHCSHFCGIGHLGMTGKIIVD